MRNSAKYLAGAVAMITLGASVALSQQDTSKTRPTSARRIPITKEGGEVTGRGRVIHDTVTVYRTDTLRVNVNTPATVVHDTVRMTNTVTRVDTVQLPPPVVPIRLPSGLYFGLSAGVMAPNGAIFTPNSAGPSAQAQLGWQGAKNMLGLRGDVNWAKPGEDSRFSGPQADPDILNFSADLKLQLPFLTHMFGATHRFGIYGIGGYTHTMFKNLPMRVDSPAGTNLAVFTQGTGEWTHENGWNAGGGASLSWRRTEIFIESRVLSFDPSNAPQARQIPFMFGMNWYPSYR